MIDLECELAEHLHNLSGLGPLEPGSYFGEAAGSYVGAALGGWGFSVERPVWPQANGAGQAWGLIGRLGYGPLGRVQLRACLQPQFGESGDPGVAGVAVLLALGRFLSQYQLRYGLDAVVHCGPLEREPLGVEAPGIFAPGAGPVLAVLCFDSPGQLTTPNRVGASGVSAALATGARRLLARYPDVVWDDRRSSSCADGVGREALPGLWVGAGRPATALWSAYSSMRLREAAMLGAEIVSLLQTQTAATCRPEGLAA